MSRQNLRSRKFRRLDRFEETGQPLPADVAYSTIDFLGASGAKGENFRRTATALEALTAEIIFVGECLDGGNLLLLHVIDVIVSTAYMHDRLDAR